MGAKKQDRKIKASNKRIKEWCKYWDKQRDLKCALQGHQMRLIPEINTGEEVCMACGKLESELKKRGICEAVVGNILNQNSKMDFNGTKLASL